MITVLYMGHGNFTVLVCESDSKKLAVLSAEVDRPASHLIQEWLRLGFQLYAGLITPEENSNADKT